MCQVLTAVSCPINPQLYDWVIIQVYIPMLKKDICKIPHLLYMAIKTNAAVELVGIIGFCI